MSVPTVSRSRQSETFAHFFPPQSRENDTIQLFIKALLPLLNQQWCLNTYRILHKIRSFKDQMKIETYEKCLNATQKYFNSRDFSVAGRYEVKKSWFFSGIQSYGETPCFQQLNSGLKDLLKEVQPRKASWSESFRACWNGFIDCCSSAVSYTYHNPGKTACTFLALETAALAVRSYQQNSTFDGSTSIVPWANSPESHWSCGSNLVFGLSGTLLTQNPIFITAAGASCMPMAFGQIVNRQIPDQLLNIGDPFSLDINTTKLFGEPVTDITVKQVDGTLLPDWLSAGPTIVGNFPMQALDVQVRDTLAYITDNTGGLKIIDISDSAHPYLKGNYISNYPSLRVALNGNFAYVVEYQDLKIIDISDSTHPFLISSFTTCSSQDVAISGNLIYIADSFCGLKIIDVSDIVHPYLKSSLQTNRAMGVSLIGDLAYIADYNNGLTVVDVSNSTQPILLNSFRVIGGFGITVKDNLAYVSGSESGVAIVNVTNPTHPVLLSYFPTTQALKVALEDTSLFVADGGGGLKIIDVTNPSQPALRGSLATTCVRGIALSNDFAYLADSDRFKVLDLSNWRLSGIPVISKQNYQVSINSKTANKNSNVAILTDYFPKLLNSISSQSVLPGKTVSLPLDLNNLFQDKDVSDGLSLSIMSGNSSNYLPEFIQFQMKPFVEGVLPGTSVVGVVVRDNLAYVLDGINGLAIVDISNSTNPILKTLFPLSPVSEVVSIGIDYQLAIAIDDKLAYVRAPGGIKIIDVSDILHPFVKGSFPTTTSSPHDIVIRNKIAYVADGYSGLRIDDVNNSTHPILKNILPLTGASATNIAISDDSLYLADYINGLKIFDITNSTNPVLKTTFTTETAYITGVAVNGHLAYAVCPTRGTLNIIDVSNSTNPILIGRYFGLSHPTAITVRGGLAFVADFGGGLKIIDVTDSTHPILKADLRTSDALRIALNGNTAYLADRQGGLKIIDLNGYQFIATPTHANEGNYELVVTATDPQFATTNTSFVLRVEGAPRLMQPLPRQMAIIGQPFSSFIPEGTFSDPNNDVITYSSKSLPSFLTFNPTSATLWGVPGDADKGEYNITILATDRLTEPTPAQWSILVHYAPLLNKPIPDQVANIGHLFQFTLEPNTFMHKDGYSLTYTARQDNLDQLPSWLNFNAQTQTLSGIPHESDKRHLTVAIKANDGLQGQTTGAFDLVVEHFPRLVKNFPTIYSAVGHPFVFDASSYFMDEDEEPLQFSASSEGDVLPKSLTFDKGGRFSGTLQLSDKKVIPITLTAMDPSGGKVTAIFNITLSDYAKVITGINPPEVIIDNRSPQLIEPLLGQTLTAEVRGDFSVKSSFEDPDGDPLTFRADLDNADWLTLDPISGQFSGTPSSRDAATYATRRYTIGVTATDPANKTAAGSFDILLQGPSLTEKILNALLWISGFAVATYGYYQKKYLLWNWCRKKKYQKPDWNITVGQTGVTYQVDYPADRIKQINVIRIKDRCCLSKDSCCFDICKNTEERISAGSARADFFNWLYYDPRSNQFRIIEDGPDEDYRNENIQIQVRGTDNRIREQFTIKVRDAAVVSPNAIIVSDPLAIALQEINASSASASSSPQSMSALSMSALSSSSSSAQSSESKQALLKTPLLDSAT